MAFDFDKELEAIRVQSRAFRDVRRAVAVAKRKIDEGILAHSYFQCISDTCVRVGLKNTWQEHLSFPGVIVEHTLSLPLGEIVAIVVSEPSIALDEHRVLRDYIFDEASFRYTGLHIHSLDSSADKKIETLARHMNDFLREPVLLTRAYR